MEKYYAINRDHAIWYARAAITDAPTKSDDAPSAAATGAAHLTMPPSYALLAEPCGTVDPLPHSLVGCCPSCVTSQQDPAEH